MPLKRNERVGCPDLAESMVGQAHEADVRTSLSGGPLICLHDSRVSQRDTESVRSGSENHTEFLLVPKGVDNVSGGKESVYASVLGENS